MRKILTIVVPTYNMEDYLDCCLSSMIIDDSTLMSALEVIIVNDGSSDRSLDIAISYKEKYPNTFIVIDKKNGNYGSCVNCGLKEASGKYFRMVDADDWVDTNSLVFLLNMLKQCTCDLVFTDYVERYQSYSNNVSISSYLNSGTIYSIDSFSYKEWQFPLQMHGMTFLTAKLKQCGLSLTEGISYTDTEYCYYPLSLVESFIYFNLPLYQYRADREGQTMSKNSLVRSTLSMHNILVRLLEHGWDNARGVQRQFQLQVLKRILGLYYNTIITQCSKTTNIDAQLNSIHSIIKTLPELLTFVYNLNKHKIKYVRIWECTGIYNSSFVFSAYNHLYELLLKIFKTNQ